MDTVLISEFMDPDVADDLIGQFGGTYDPTLVDRRDELKTRLANARALLVRNRTKVDEDLLAAAPKLEVLGRLGVGLDNIDLAACAKRSVAVRPAVGANHVSVAEYVMGAILALSRPMLFASERVVAGEWPRNSIAPGREIAGRTLGLLGFGLIARTVAVRARAFGMRVKACDPMVAPGDSAWVEWGVEAVGFDELLRGSDFLSLHIPLTEETRGILGREALQMLPEGAVLINSARGGIVDEAALADALRSGHLGGAALDVFASEPLSEVNNFKDVPNVILSPHLAGITEESSLRMSEVVAAAVRLVLRK